MRIALLPAFVLALAPACNRSLDEPSTPAEEGSGVAAPSEGMSAGAPSAAMSSAAGSAAASPAAGSAEAPPASASAGAPPAAGSAEAPPASASAAATPAEGAELDPRFVPLIAAAFRDYGAWGRVDDELRWAPWLCRLPLPGRARMSAAEDGGHARKLYSVFAKHRDRYPLVEGADPVSQPEGQVLVKESYHAELADEPPPADLAPAAKPHGDADHFDPYLRDGERLYRASRLAGIYVLLKTAPGTPDTDAGWIYGTVTPEGEVTSAGRVASCMGCHVSARHERVFGLPATSAASP